MVRGRDVEGTKVRPRFDRPPAVWRERDDVSGFSRKIPPSPSPLFSLFSIQIRKLLENGRGKRLLLFRACCGASEGERSWSVGGGETCRWKNKTFLRISRKTVRGGNGEWEKGGGRESAGPGFRGGGLYGEARRNWSGGGAAVKEEEKLANERKARPLLNRMRKKEGLSCFSGSAPC